MSDLPEDLPEKIGNLHYTEYEKIQEDLYQHVKDTSKFILTSTGADREPTTLDILVLSQGLIKALKAQCMDELMRNV